jgi:hypothetical protein
MFEIDGELMAALRLLAADEKRPLDDLLTEAVKDLLKKRGRPANLREALRMSLRQFHVNDNGSASKARLR